MTTNPRYPDDRDPEVTRLLRAAYRAPADPAYWEGLEQRIMSRIAAAAATPATQAAEWWEAFAGWTRAGLVAAGIAAAMVATALMQTRAAEARLAYEAVVEAPPALAGAQVLRAPGISDRAAALRDATEY
jgi:hypothetical protein